MPSEPLRIEITLTKPGEWRVVERSLGAAENVSRVAFSVEELPLLLEEIRHCLLDANLNMDVQRVRLRRLGGRLAELALPQLLREKTMAAANGVEFFLDDEAMTLPVELFPCGESVLAEATPVARHWFCENARQLPGKKAVGLKQALIIADPSESLPNAQLEGASLFRRLRPRRKDWHCRFLGRAVTCGELNRELPDTNLLHLAAHYRTGDSDAASGVVMADGMWMPSAASHAPDVVFANCCRAGLTGNIGGGISLAGRFLEKGSRHVIAPFLPASDNAARVFAEHFYQAFMEGRGIAQSVCRARAEVGPAGWMYRHFGSVTEAEDAVSAQAGNGNTPSPRLKKWLIGAALAIVFLLILLASSRNDGKTIATSPIDNSMAVIENDAAPKPAKNGAKARVATVIENF